MESLLGGLLIGGTNVWMVTAVPDESIFKIIQEEAIKTSDHPDETLSLIAQFFNKH